MNTQPGKVLVANATTTGIKVEAQVIEFILQTLQLGTVNEQINILQIACTNTHIEQCKLSVMAQTPVVPMYFMNISNRTEGIRCESTLKLLRGTYGSDPDNMYYLSRYCKLSQLDLELQAFYSNSMQLLAKRMNNTITQIGIVSSLLVAGGSVEIPLQAVDIEEFNRYFIIFNLKLSYKSEIGDIDKLRNISQWFDFGYDLRTGLVECQQNSGSALSCYLQLYIPPIKIHTTMNTIRSRLLSKYLSSEPAPQPITSFSYFTEFIDWQNTLVRISPINLPTILSTDKISAINLNFIVFTNFSDSMKVKNSSSTLKILQRGTSNDLGEIEVKGKVIALKNLGQNLILYGMSDIGLVFKDIVSNTTSFKVALYTIQLPYFKIESGSTNKSHQCFGYLKGCHQVYFNFSYRISLKNENTASLKSESPTMNKILPFFLIDSNFTAILPKSTERVIEIEIQRDRVVFNLTDLFFGLPFKFYSIPQEYMPRNMINSLKITDSSECFLNLNVMITNIMYLTNDEQATSSFQPYLLRRPDGSVMFTFRVVHLGQGLPFDTVHYLLDPIDANIDTEIIFSAENLLLYAWQPLGIDAVLVVDDTAVDMFTYIYWPKSISAGE